MISEIKSEQTLKDITEAIVDCEHKTAPTQEFGIPLIRTTDIQNGRLNLNKANRVSEEIYKIWSARMEPKPGDIILAREAPVGEVGMAPKDERVCLGQRTVLIRIDKEKANPRYVLYLLCTTEMKHEMISRASGSVVPHLNMSDIRVLPISELPDLSKQEQIGRILGTLDDRMVINSKMNKILEHIAKTIFKHWFIDFEFPNEEGKPYKSSGGEMIYNEELGKEIPRGWGIGFLGDGVLTKISKPGVTKFTGEKIYLDTSSVQDSYIAKLDYKITYDERPSRANMQPKISTIWFAKMKESKKILFFDNYSNFGLENFILSTGFAGLDVEDFAFYYIWCLISNAQFEKEKDNLCNGTTMQAINNENIMKIRVINPGKTILTKFNNLTKSIYQKVYENNVQSLNLSRLRDSLLPKLMSGKIRVPVEVK